MFISPVLQGAQGNVHDSSASFVCNFHKCGSLLVSLAPEGAPREALCPRLATPLLNRLLICDSLKASSLLLFVYIFQNSSLSILANNKSCFYFFFPKGGILRDTALSKVMRASFCLARLLHCKDDFPLPCIPTTYIPFPCVCFRKKCQAASTILATVNMSLFP